MMNAVIMAGGEGTRLAPFTADRPKPMMKLLGYPIMEHLLVMLKTQGIRQGSVTLHYMPNAIREYFGDGSRFGIMLSYTVEQFPMGTAGSVKMAARDEKEPFAVVSGDALTDIDLNEALRFHLEKKAALTVVTSHVQVPVEYGIVISDEEGRISRFSEKPSWGDVFTDTANTGIYIIEPEVLKLIPENTKFDFAADLFPLMLEKGMPLYAYDAPGYWCDIGTPEQYIQAHADALNSKMRLPLLGTALNGGVFCTSYEGISTEATLNAPLFIDKDVHVQPGAVVGPNVYVGPGSLIESGARVQESVLGQEILIQRNSTAESCVLADRSHLQEDARIENSLIGHDAVIGKAAALKDTKIYPYTYVDDRVQLRGETVKQDEHPPALFSEGGLSGVINADLSPQLLLKAAAAFATLFAPGSRIGVAVWGESSRGVAREAVDAGLLSTGIAGVDLGKQPLWVCRFAVARFQLQGAVFVQAHEGRIRLLFLDEKGCDLSEARLRKAEQNLTRSNIRKVAYDRLHEMVELKRVRDFYISALRNAGLEGRHDRVCLECGPGMPVPFVTELFRACGGNLWPREEADMILHLDRDGFFFETSEGFRLAEAELQALMAALLVRNGFSGIPLPRQAMLCLGESSMKKRMAPCAQDRWMEALSAHRESRRLVQAFFDPFGALALILRALEEEDTALENLSASLAAAHTSHFYADCPLTERGRVVRELLSLEDGSFLEGGVVFSLGQGIVTIIPQRHSRVFDIRADSTDMETARELGAFYADKVRTLAKGERRE